MVQALLQDVHSFPTSTVVAHDSPELLSESHLLGCAEQVEFVLGNLLVSFRQPGLESSDADVSHDLSISVLDGVGKEQATIEIHNPDCDGVTPLIESLMWLQGEVTIGKTVTTEQLAKLLMELTPSQCEYNGSLGSSIEEVLKGYENLISSTGDANRHAKTKARIHSKVFGQTTNAAFWSIDRVNDIMKEEIGKNLRTDKLECSTLTNVSSSRALVEVLDQHLLITLHELAPQNDDPTRYSIIPLHVVATRDKVVAWSEKDSPFLAKCPKQIGQQLSVYTEQNVGTILYTLLQDLLHYNHTVIGTYQDKVKTLESSMDAPLDEQTLTHDLRHLKNTANKFFELVSSQQVLSPSIDAFLAHNNLEKPKNAARIFDSLQSQTLHEVDQELRGEVNSIRKLHADLSDVRNGAMAKKIAILSAFTLPQLVASALVGPLTTISTATLLGHGIGFCMSLGLVFAAYKRRWMWP